MKIKIGKKTWRFVDSFADFNAETIAVYMSIHNELDRLLDEANAVLEKAEALIPSDIETKEDEEIALLQGRIGPDYEKKRKCCCLMLNWMTYKTKSETKEQIYLFHSAL